MTALDTGSEDLLAEVDEGVAAITMNRPSRRNAFSDEMVQHSASDTLSAPVRTDSPEPLRW